MQNGEQKNTSCIKVQIIYVDILPPRRWRQVRVALIDIFPKVQYEKEGKE